ncbi:sigma 54-interacting transcriptional regulator [Candidatus Margulisiibacteriota bacterium]
MYNNRSTILIVEDEESMREVLELALRDKYTLLMAEDGKEAVNIVSNETVDLVLLDMILPALNGLEVLEQIKAMDNTLPVIMITAVKTVNSAVSAMKKGAYDYITKPFDIQELEALAEKALEKRILEKENKYLKNQLDKQMGFEKIIGRSPAIREIFKMINDVAVSRSTVLLYGESGTGKEMVARAIHNRSPRAKKLFVAVNCAAIPENLLESELFGHEKGSFTGAIEQHLGKFELAHKGTLFLDEIGSLPLPMQAKLLRAIQEKSIERVGGNKNIKVDARIIAATNTNLRKAIETKKFREDLFYRLNVIPLFIPPLRERKEDIMLLAHYFLKKYSLEFGKKVKGFTEEASKLIGEYGWPGNVRELENLIERLVVLGKEDMISVSRLPSEISKTYQISPLKSFEESMDETSKKFEAGFIESVTKRTNLNERQLKAINYIKKEGKITKEKYIRLNNTTKTTAFRDLNNLAKMDILTTRGTGKSTFYTLHE